jgi:hypothetical protein
MKLPGDVAESLLSFGLKLKNFDQWVSVDIGSKDNEQTE